MPSWLPLVGKCAGAGLLAAVAALGLLYVRLMLGPMALNFLARPIEAAIAEELAGSQVRVEGVALGLNDRGLLQFELRNVRVTDENGETIVAAPSVAVSISRRALLGGRVAVESLDLMSARLVLFYADDGSLALKFSSGATAAGEPDVSPPRTGGPAVSTPGTSAAEPSSTTEVGGTLRRIDIVKVLSEASARARRQENASAYLREVGLRSATVVIDNGRRTTVWQVPELDIDLDHRRTRSSIAGRARIESQDGSWELAFRSNESVRNKAFKVAVSLQGLVPRALAMTFPQLLALEGLDLPVSIEAQLDLSNSGEIIAGTMSIDAAGGNLALPGPKAAPMRIGGGHIELTYDGATTSFQIAPSELTWNEGRVQLAGAIVHTAEGSDGPRWRFDIKATEGWVTADARSPMRLPVDQLSATGFLAPQHGRIVLDEFVVRAGGAEVTARGEVSDIGGAIQARLDGKIGAMSVGLFKTLWPSWLAPQARAWASERLLRGEVHGGTFKIVRGSAQSRGDWTPVTDPDRMTLALEGSNLELAVMDGWPALQIPRALLSVEGASVEISVPEAIQSAADGRKLSLKGTFAVDLGQALPREGRLAVKGQAPLSLVIDMVAHEAPSVLQNLGFPLAGSEGTVDGNVVINVPLKPQPELHEATVEGRLRVVDAKIPQALGGKQDVQGINLTVDIAPAAFEAKGKFLLGNVPAMLVWQHVYGAAPEKQPPLRISGVLYDAERTELGLDLNDLVHGETSVEITVMQDAKGEPQVHLRADLANAELTIEALGWRKPVGKRAVFDLDFAKGTAYPVEMRNVRLDGENVAVAGWMGAGDDFHIKEYRFPQFSLDVVSNFEARGKLRSDNVWDVTAKGPTFDGRDLFKSFFFVAPEKLEKDKPGLDLRAEFDTVLGFFETSIRGVRVTYQKRGPKPNQLDARGTFAGGKQLEAVVRPDPGRPRILTARSNDAGQVFKLVGFLPHAVGGDMNLEVNLDGKGPVERTGTLSASHFYLLGDVISVDGPAGQGPGARKRNVVREKIEFDTLRAPFSVGSGQFVLQDARIDGPLISATMSGRVDFRTRKVHVVGTFTPLAALNKMLSPVPLLGDIVTGPNREGVFAWNYALQGGIENPQIVVNPMSGVAPGFTREFFPVLPEEPATLPRKGARGGDSGARASSSPVSRPGGSDTVTASPSDVGDGWISDALKK